MPNLGDFFPNDLKEQFAFHNFKIGSVLRYQVDFTNPPKIKRLVIVGFDAEKVLFASALINTEINPNIFTSTALRDLHLELDAVGRPYLDHTSYVNCSEIFEQDIETVKKLLIEQVSTHVGELSEQDLEAVLEKIRNAKTIPIKLKKKYGLFNQP